MKESLFKSFYFIRCKVSTILESAQVLSIALDGPFLNKSQ